MPERDNRPWSIALASREVWPFVEGGGIGRCVWAVARLLAPHADVTIVTSARWRERYDDLAAAADPRLTDGVRIVFAEEPEGDLGPFVSWHHAWSVRLMERIAAVHPDGGPDLVEVADYQGEGFALAHALRGHDPRFRNTRLVVRLSTSSEICAVLNETPADPVAAMVRGIERFPLRFADAVLWPGGDALAYYEDFYGSEELGPAIRSALPTTDDMTPAEDAPPPPTDGPLRILFLNRLERRKGIEELISAVRVLPDAAVHLTVVGRDTSTAPGGGSMESFLRDLAGDDPRIEFAAQVPHAEVPALIASHHLVAIPSRWETFSYVTREALAANRPVIATAAGAIADVVVAERSGWLAPSSSPEDLAATLSTALEQRDLIAAMIEEERPRSVYEEAQTNEEQVEVYRSLVGAPAPAWDGRRTIDAIVALDRDGTGLGRTLRSLSDQNEADAAAVVVLGAEQRQPDAAELARMARLVPRASADGRPAAWSEGLDGSDAEYVALLPGGTVLDERFLARAAAALGAVPDVDYVTAFVDAGSRPWHAPLGSYELPLDAVDAGASVALFRRTTLADLLADGAPADEAALYARAADRGAIGLVLQEPLVERLPKRPSA